MRHFEIFYVHNIVDVKNIEYRGLLEFDYEEYCEHCSEPVGYLEDDDFEQCVVVRDGISTFLLCSVCALPVLNPGVDL